MNIINDPSHPVILFIPEIGIYPYARGLAVIGDAITKQGGKVFITHDTGQMLRSPIMAMYNTSINISVSEREKIKKATESCYKAILRNYNFSSIELSDFVNRKLIKEINSLEIDTNSDLRKIQFRGFPVGQIAEYDFILDTKFTYYKNLSVSHRKLYLQYVKNTALAVAISDGICEQYKPSLFLTFNEYAQCQAVRYSANKHGIERMALTYPVHFDIDASRFSIWKPTYEYWIYDHCQKWDKWKNIPINEKHVALCWDDSIFRMYDGGSHIFSSRKRGDPSDIFNSLNLDPKCKTIVVYTSSQDEIRCSEISMLIWGEKWRPTNVFSSQIDWLRMLRKYAVKKSNIQIIVRIHPREGVGILGINSQHLRRLKSEFKQSTKNFIIVWPDDPISSYDLMELADLCLISWSLMGQEAARVGIPVLSYVRNMFYPDDDFIQTAGNLKEYESKLDSMLNMGYKWNHLVKAVRFYHWRTFIPSLDLGDMVPTDYDDHSVWPKTKPVAIKDINNIVSGNMDLIKCNIKKWNESLPPHALYREGKAMKKSIRYFIDKIYFKSNNFWLIYRILRYILRKITRNSLSALPSSYKDYNLKYTVDVSRIKEYISKTRKNPRLRYIVANNLQAILIYRGKVLKRMSPMILRLAKLHENT